MIDTKRNPDDTFYTVESASSYYGYDQLKTYAEAEERARRNAYSDGKDYFIMAPIAKAEKPLAVNDVKVTKL